MRLLGPVGRARPVLEETAHRHRGILVATEQKNLSTHVAHGEIFLKWNEEILEVVTPEQFNDALVVGILHHVAIGLVKHVDDNELRRMGCQRVAKQLKGILEMNTGGHDAMIQVHIVFVDARPQVESPHAHAPLRGDVEVLGTGKSIAQILHSFFPPTARSGIVSTGNREYSHIDTIWQALHPIIGKQRAATKEGSHQQGIHFLHGR